jgi:spore coat polysaccharide biosynthesis protein SpsF
MEINAVIQVRTGSTRFPSKIFMELNEKNTVLDYVIKQLKFSKKIKNIIIATTTQKQDEKIIEYAKKNNLDYFRGKELDVLDRYYKCAKEFSLDPVLRITSDAPFLDPTIIDEVIEKYEKSNYDFVSNNMIRTYPIGIDAEIFSMEALEKTWKEADLPSEREHVTSYMKKKDVFKKFNLKNNSKIPIYRLTVDRKEDLEFLRTISSKISKQPILLKDILDLFSKEPDILKLYNNIDPVEGYNKSLNEDKEFLKKNGKNTGKNFSFKETI